MTYDWDITVKMSYFKKDIEKNAVILSDIADRIADQIGGSIVSDNGKGAIDISAEAKIQTDIESYWDSIFEDYADLDNSVGVEAYGNGVIIWRYKNGKCTYCAWDNEVYIG